MKAPSLTLGIEEEYQVVDPCSRDLRAYITQILEDGHVTVDDIRPELHQSVIEVGSRICHTPAEVGAEIRRLRREVAGLAGEKGLTVVAAGTHPFSSWLDQRITPLERYLGIETDLQDLARKNLIFGMHVHVGIESRDFRMEAMTACRRFLPLLVALSSSSPFWMGRNTGLKSYRSCVWRNFPRSGTPPAIPTWREYDGLVRTLVNAHSMEDGSKIWWDVRPSCAYPTLEFRVCDMCTRVEEAVCMAAMVQALVAKLWKLRRDRIPLPRDGPVLLSENKWRAARYGLDGKLIALDELRERPVRELLEQFVRGFLDDVLDELGTRREVEYAFKILEQGSSADRQLEVYGATGDLRAVVDHLIRETRQGISSRPHPPPERAARWDDVALPPSSALE